MAAAHRLFRKKEIMMGILKDKRTIHKYGKRAETKEDFLIQPNRKNICLKKKWPVKDEVKTKEIEHEFDVTYK